jgi:ribose 5-phosphate isomerase A
MATERGGDGFKRAAAKAALDLIEPGMRLGLGTGSTAAHFVDLLGAQVRDGLRVIGVPTSEATRRQAEALGIPLTTLDDMPALDLTIDGADEIDPAFRLIKGGGGALLREKIVATASARMVVIADHTKLVPTLGCFPLPVEIVAFGHAATRHSVAAVCRELTGSDDLRWRVSADGRGLFTTDSGHLILDCALGRIDEPDRLASALVALPGVVEHGLFIHQCDTAILAGPDGVAVLGRTA